MVARNLGNQRCIKMEFNSVTGYKKYGNPKPDKRQPTNQLRKTKYANE